MRNDTIRVENPNVEKPTEERCESFWNLLAEMIAEEYLESMGMMFIHPRVVEAS